ncbi:MAG: hypothetical protein HZB71_09660 [Betaproteobacteria bacterium]|nr:hypothetical protein [Betaproteobacteria bacterium]
MQSILEREAFSLRLRECLARMGAGSGTGPSWLAREFNRRYPGAPVSLHAARKWLLGEAIPAQDKLRVLSDWLGVTAEWLRYGAGSAYVLREPSPGAGLDYPLMREIAALSDLHREAVRELVSALRRAEEVEKTRCGGKNEVSE